VERPFTLSFHFTVIPMRIRFSGGKPMSLKLSLPSLATRLLFAVTAAAMFLPSAGCQVIRAIDESAALTYRDFVWARRAYNLRYGTCKRPYAEHFEAGFCAGYEDVCQGGDGYVPALPPDDYRSFEFQSTDGSKCVNAWFEGYPAGVAAAKQDKAGDYHDVMISRMVNDAVEQSKTQPKLAQDADAQKRSSTTAMPKQPQASNASNGPISISPINPMPSVVSPIQGSEPFDVSVDPPVVPANFRLPNSGAPMPMGTAPSYGN
jgi:hypothetical protein